MHLFVIICDSIYNSLSKSSSAEYAVYLASFIADVIGFWNHNSVVNYISYLYIKKWVGLYHRFYKYWFLSIKLMFYMIEHMFCGHSFRIFRREVTFLPYSFSHRGRKPIFLRNMLTMINMHLLHARHYTYIHFFI